VSFVAEQATWGPGSHLLAQACEHADLTPIQAEAARLASGGATFRAISETLALSYRTARDVALKAERKLRRALPDARRLQRQNALFIFQCLRNGTPRLHARNPAIYPPIPGGYDRRPVSLRPRPEGELPEDLTDRPLRFLRDLPTLLKELQDTAAQSAVGFCS
jgi:DNA-binding CsgD family transcriptional regulator